MHQLLTAAIQSALSSKGTAESKLSAEDSSAETGKGEFARALMAGLETADSEEIQLKDASAMVKLMVTEEASAGSESEGMQRFEFDDKVVGEPVQAPILEVLEAMQKLLPKSAEADEVSQQQELPVAEDIEAAIAKIDDVLAALQLPELLPELSSQQRQEFAVDYVDRLSPEQRQQLLDMDINAAGEAITRIAEQLEQRTNTVASVDTLPAAAVKQTDEKQAIEFDQDTVDWLTRQLQTLPEQNSRTSETQQAEQQVEPIRQLQKIVDALPNSELKAELGKQLQQIQQTQQIQPSVAISDGDVEAVKNLTSEQRQQLQQLVDALPKSELKAQLSQQLQQVEQLQQPSLQQAQAVQQPVTSRNETAVNQATPPQPAGPSALNTEQQQPLQKIVDELPDSDLKTQLKSSLLTEQGVKLGDQQINENKASTASLTAATAATTQVGSEPDTLLSQQINAPQTTVKAAETSSTAQSLMQAIQKPFDPQQSEASQKLQERINIMLSKNIQRADIRIDPPELGQLQVRVNMNSEQASVQFQVQSQQAREVIENAMPRLREMLEQQGVALADTDVKEQQQGSSSDQQHQSGAGSEAEEEQQYQIAMDNGKPVALGSVDFYV